MSINKRYFSDEIIALNAQASTGVSDPINVRDYKGGIVFSVDTDGGGDADLTVKFQGSIQESVPDFSAVQSVTNSWEYIEVKDYEDGAGIDGDDGIVIGTPTPGDDHRLVKINLIDVPLRWVSVRVTARAEGEVTVKARLFS
jgi:hypothetical protein